MKNLYDKKFYIGHLDGSTLSAQAILPFVCDIVKPASAVDIGCGVGTWLSVLKANHHVQEVLGVDGDYVDRNMLKIEKNEFVAHDLTKPFFANKKYDLAISMEVAEHLPESAADNFVKLMASVSDVVLFSAAVPGQIGTNHINEQFPEYWAKKFMAHGYIPVDYIRKKVWNNKQVEWWYKQNAILYVNQRQYPKYQAQLEHSRIQTDPEFLTRIHPEMMFYFQQKFFQLNSFMGFIRYKLYPLKMMFKGKGNS